MKNLFTITLLLLSLNLSATETPCNKAETLQKETLLAMHEFNINENQLQNIFLKVVSATSENRNYKDVIDSMLLNKTITKEYYLTIDLFMRSFKQRMICEGKY